jgi:acetyl-CoA acyltransferase
VVAGARTPFVKSFGKLIHLDAIGLAVASVKGLLEGLEPALDPATIDEVVFGNVVVKSAAPNIARELVLDAGLPKHIAGTTVICQCLSGLECVAQAARLIETADASVVVAGGSDSTSSGEIALHRSLSTVLGEYVMGGGNKKGLSGVRKLLRGIAGATKLPQQPSIAERSTGQTMGYHADLMAEINGVERPEQDAWAIDSHNKACAARSAGLLAEEIVAVAGADGGELVEDDELIREGMTTQQLAKLKGVFRDQGARAADESAGVDGSGAGTVTAASSSALTDGASAVGKSSSNP